MGIKVESKGYGDGVAWLDLESPEWMHIRHEEGRDVPGRDGGAELDAIFASVE